MYAFPPLFTHIHEHTYTQQKNTHIHTHTFVVIFLRVVMEVARCLDISKYTGFSSSAVELEDTMRFLEDCTR